MPSSEARAGGLGGSTPSNDEREWGCFPGPEMCRQDTEREVWLVSFLSIRKEAYA